MPVILANLVIWVLAPVFFLLAAYGAVRSFSGVPHWDSWDGYLAFYFKVLAGDWKAWWAQHNEHRIVLSRLLFWADIAWLEGGMAMLISVNYVLMLGVFLTWRAIVRERAGAAQASSLRVRLLLAFMFICLFSWMQWENFVWEFQSQFILAQWLPLVALWFLYRSAKRAATASRWFTAACAIGVLCVGTMVNGVMALPLMAGYALWLRMGWRKVLLLAALAGSCMIAYWHDTQPVGSHGDVVRGGGSSASMLIQYVLLYLGAPFKHAFGKSVLTGQLAGAVLVVLAVRKAWQFVRAPQQHALEWSLLFYVAYIGGTALATGLGRALFGLEQAASSRYATPALMAWMAILVLHQPWLLSELRQRRWRVAVPLTVLLLALTPVQWKARKDMDDATLERRAGALSMALGVHDIQQIRTVFYDPLRGVELARQAADAHRSIYRTPAFAQVKSMGQAASTLPTTACQAVIFQRSAVPDDAGYYRVEGAMAKPDGADEPVAARIVAADGSVAGYAVMGKRSKWYRDAFGLGGDARFFLGYVMASHMAKPWTLDVLGTGCVAHVASTGMRVDTAKKLDASAITVMQDQILTNQGWDGSDFEQSHAAGLRVLGTYIHGDQDTGSVRLALRRGDRLLYRTGPTVARQRFLIDGNRFGAGFLPKTERWSVLVLDDPKLPERFEVTLSDEGSKWGEWMAIAVKDKSAGTD